jgi:phosphatidylglycerol---prolipoprotein diacylglyceryl transferase
MLYSISVDIFGIEGFIYPYSILMGIGFTHLLFGITKSAQAQKMSDEVIESFQLTLIISICFGYVGASAAAQLLAGEKVIPLDTLTVMPGFIVGTIVLCLGLFFQKMDVKYWISLAIPYWCFAHAWGRLGCFLGGCCFGTPTDSIFGLTFPEDSIPSNTHGHISLHPTQLYEAFALTLIGITSSKLNISVSRIYFFFITYGITRYIIEEFRGDERGIFSLMPNLSPSQSLSLLFVIVGSILFIISLSHKQNKMSQPH